VTQPRIEGGGATLPPFAIMRRERCEYHLVRAQVGAMSTRRGCPPTELYVYRYACGWVAPSSSRMTRRRIAPATTTLPGLCPNHGPPTVMIGQDGRDETPPKSPNSCRCRPMVSDRPLPVTELKIPVSGVQFSPCPPIFSGSCPAGFSGRPGRCAQRCAHAELIPAHVGVPVGSYQWPPVSSRVPCAAHQTGPIRSSASGHY
jgi:hypothetical protein